MAGHDAFGGTAPRNLASLEIDADPPRRPVPLLDWPVAWGGAAAAIFYFFILPNLPAGRELAERYFNSHPIEHATTVLFFVGLALLTKKSLGLGRERSAASTCETAAVKSPADVFATLPRSLRHTVMGERLRGAAEHLAAPGGSGDLSGHLKYLAELAADRLHGSYALVRTITWAVPILGFLGTVQGITLAIANVNPDQLSNSLGGVTGGLAVAFDTTALSLFLSLLLVFAAFAVERAEQSVYDRVERFALLRLASLGASAPASPLVRAEEMAAAELLTRTDLLIRGQTALWQEAIEGMRHRWTATLDGHQDDLRDALTAGMRRTLDDHAAGLQAARADLVAAVNACADRLDAALDQSDRERGRQLEAFSGDLARLWDRSRSDLDGMRAETRDAVAGAAASVAADLREWREELRGIQESAVDRQAALNRHSEQLARIADGAADLNRMQTRLTDNLDALRATETLQDAVHSLTAAAHLLSARPRLRDAA